MWERITELRDFLFRRREIPLFEDFAVYVESLRPGDRFIFRVLGCLVILASLLSIRALEQKALVVQPMYGGSLTEGVVGSPRYVNPLLALSETDQDLTALTYAGLMGEGPDGTPVPVLAESYTISPDGRVYTFVLKKDVKFSDGTPVTASDVVFTVQKAKDPALKSPQLPNWSNVGVTAIDARTVQFTLATPYAPFIEDTTLGILPAHIWRNINDAEFPFSDQVIKPVGAGPFVPAQITRDSKAVITSYDLVANDHYALRRPYLDGIRFEFFDDQATLKSALTKNQIQSAYGVTGSHELHAPYSRVFAVFFNPGESDTLAKAPVREALSIAIDRTGIVKNLLGGYATALMGPVPPGAGVPAISVPSSEGRTANALSVLEDAGWSYSTSTASWKNSTGQTLSITLKTSNVPELKAIANAIQADWNLLHVPTSIQLYEPGDLIQTVIRPRSYQALLFGMVVGKGDDLYDFWNSKEKTDPGLNIAEYNNPKVDDLLVKLRTENDPATRTSYLSQINQLIAADYPAAFIESPDFVYVVPNNLKGVILPQITLPADRFATVSTWYVRTESVWPFLARKSK